MHGIAGLTIDEIIRTARRETWGPLPGDPDYEEVLYTLAEAAELTGISHTNLCARIQRGRLLARRRDRLYVVSELDLVLSGLLAPSQRLSRSYGSAIRPAPYASPSDGRDRCDGHH